MRENYEDDAPPAGWLAMDQSAWLRSHQMVQRLVRLYDAKIVFGHDLDVFRVLVAEQVLM